jgi:hypothetical protein
MVTGNLPYLTKGPFALFYGGADIIPKLSSESPDKHTTISTIVFIVFHIIMIFYKKLTMRKFSTLQRMNEIIVSSFLNVLNLFMILFVMSLLIFGLFHHYNTIKNNSDESNENKSPDDSWKNLLEIALIETMGQTFPFLTNPALR